MTNSPDLAAEIVEWSCDEKDAKGACRNAHGCHCATISRLHAALRTAQAKNTDVKNEAAGDAQLRRKAQQKLADVMGRVRLMEQNCADWQKQVQAAQAKSAALEAENARLREALEPFAEAGRMVPERVSDTATCCYYRDALFMAGDFRRARAALSPDGAL